MDLYQRESSVWQAITGNRWKAIWHDIGGERSVFGFIFSFDPSSGTYTKLKDFDEPAMM